MPGEEKKYPSVYVAGHFVLPRKDGDCIYVTDTGCAIHNDAPKVCRGYDCRKQVAKLGSDEKQQYLVSIGALRASVYEAAKRMRK